MTKRAAIISFTIVAWLIGVGVYVHYWTTSVIAEYSGQLGETLVLLGFFTYRFPYLLIGLIILIIAELIFIPGLHERPGKMV